MNCQTRLKKEQMCETLYIETNLSSMYNSALCSFLNISQTVLPFKHESMKEKNDWITQGIKTSCRYKCRLNAFTRNSDNNKAKHIILNNVKFSQFKYMCKNKYHSFEADRKINGLGNNFALSDH